MHVRACKFRTKQSSHYHLAHSGLIKATDLADSVQPETSQQLNVSEQILNMIVFLSDYEGFDDPSPAPTPQIKRWQSPTIKICFTDVHPCCDRWTLVTGSLNVLFDFELRATLANAPMNFSS